MRTEHGVLRTRQEAVQELLQRVAEANACLPYSGIAVAARPDDATIAALLSLLPPPPPPDANQPPPQAPAPPCDGPQPHIRLCISQ